MDLDTNTAAGLLYFSSSGTRLAGSLTADDIATVDSDHRKIDNDQWARSSNRNWRRPHSPAARR